MTIIAVASKKGGAGKTTTAVNLGFYLGTYAETCIVDFDSQGQVALWFGQDPRSSAFDWLTGVQRLENATVAARRQGKLWLLPANSGLRVFEKLYAEISPKDFQYFVNMVKGLRQYFEHVVVDTTVGVLQEISIAAADAIIVPFRPEVPNLDGAINMANTIRAMGRTLDTVFFPVAAMPTNESRRCVADLAAIVGPDMLAATATPHRTEVGTAVAEGLTLFEYPGKRVEEIRAAYRQLATRVVGTLASNEESVEEQFYADNQHSVH